MAIGTTAAIIGSAVVGAGTSAYAANKQSSAAKKATQAQVDAADANAALQREIYYQNRSDLAPARQYEQQQLNAMGEIFGFAPYQSASQSAPNPNALYSSYVGDRQDVMDEYQRVAREGFGRHIRQDQYDLNGNGRVDQNEYGKFHFDTFGGGPGYELASGNAFQGTVTPIASGNQGNALARFEQSPFMRVAMNDYQLADDRLSNAFGAQGLQYSSARIGAREDARANIFGQQFNNYLSTLMGSPPQQATNAGLNNANAFAGQMAANNAAIGNAQAQGAYAQGNAAAAGAQGIANAGMWGIGAYGQNKGWWG